MNPCLARRRTGRHVCEFAHGHPGSHAAPGHIWDTPSPPMKRAEVCHDRFYDDGERPWKVYVHEDGVIPDRSEQILYRDSDVLARSFPTHEAALAHALAEVGLTEKETNR